MDYILKPSLGHITLVKIAITLWNQDDIKSRITNYSSVRQIQIVMGRIENDEANDWVEIEKQVLNKVNKLMLPKWRKIEEKVLNKVTKLGIPECLKEKLSGIIKPIGMELINCYEYHCELIDGKPCGLPNNLCWTSLGQVDKKKTAEVLTKDENIHIGDRYILACNYCLEDGITELWDSMPETLKARFCRDDGMFVNESDRLTFLWSRYLRKTSGKSNDHPSFDFPSFLLTDPYIMGFAYALYKNNKTATGYFLKKMNPVHREDLLMNYGCTPFYSDTIFFLLSQMNEKEQITFFHKNTYNVLKCLLEWPFQSFFKETFVRVCELDLLRENDFYAILRTIVIKICGGITFRDYNYHELLQQIWPLSPDICKKHVLRCWAEPGYVSLLHDMAIEGNVMLILNDATIQEREKIIFNHISCIIDLVYYDKWNRIKLLIQECISSTEMMIYFKNELITEFKNSAPDPDFETNMQKINQLMDELINKKRSIEEGECSQAKKPQ